MYKMMRHRSFLWHILRSSCLSKQNLNAVHRFPFNHFCCQSFSKNSFTLQRYMLYSTEQNFENAMCKSEANEAAYELLIDIASTLNNYGRIHTKDILKVLDNNNLNKLSASDHLLLLQCCGNAIPDQTPSNRWSLCQNIFKKYENCNIPLSAEYYNVYLIMATENGVLIDFKSFLSQMKTEPNQETYKLLLDNVCNSGDVIQALSTLEIMRNQNISADNRVFNSLVLGHAMHGGLRSGESIMQTMKTAHVQITNSTYISLLRGLSRKNNESEYFQALSYLQLPLQEQQLHLILSDLAIHKNFNWIPKFLQQIGSPVFSKQLLQHIELLCIHLIHLKEPFAAIAVYKEVSQYITVAHDEGTFALFLLEEMLKCDTPSDTIIKIAEDLKNLQLNALSLENITAIALRDGHEQTASDLLAAMENCRPHYFWPLLIHAARHRGEIGVFEVVKKMLHQNVKPDLETIEFYCIPFCDVSDPKQLLIRIKNLGFTIKDLLTPIVTFLLKQNRISEARQLCDEYKVNIYSTRILRQLATAWFNTGDLDCTATLLQIICVSEPNSVDIVGQFLIQALKLCRTQKHHEQFLKLVQVVGKNKLRVSSSLGDNIASMLNMKQHNCTVNHEIRSAVDDLLDLSIMGDFNNIVHPRNMNIKQLECHLIELKNKNMETRGILRRLIQEYSRQGNTERIKQLYDEFIEAGYKDSGGIKAGILQSYISTKNASDALATYTDIKSTYPTFVVDDFKILDLATLLVSENHFQSAVNLIVSESNNRVVRSQSAIERNCWRLLQSAVSEEQVQELFDLLIKYKYCVPSNVILGPLIRIHLKNDNLLAAANTYVEFTKKYHCTPLQFELFCKLGEENFEDHLQKVVAATTKVHGKTASQSTLIFALAQNGRYETLLKLLSECNTFSKKELVKKCNRWVEEDQLLPLQILIRIASRLPRVLDVATLHLAVMRIHCKRNDCKGAVAFWEELCEQEIEIPRQLIDELIRSLKRCNYDIPNTLLSRIR